MYYNMSWFNKIFSKDTNIRITQCGHIAVFSMYGDTVKYHCYECNIAGHAYLCCNITNKLCQIYDETIFTDNEIIKYCDDDTYYKYQYYLRFLKYLSWPMLKNILIKYSRGRYITSLCKKFYKHKRVIGMPDPLRYYYRTKPIYIPHNSVIFIL